MSDYIPEEVVTRILTRVPAKSLLRFRCVSKPWKSLISSPDFISLHTRQAFLSKPTIPDDRMLVRRYSKPQRTELYSVHHDNEDFTVESGKSFFLCPQAIFKNTGPFMSVLGFGYDLKNNDFKVVRIAYDRSDRGYNLPPIVEVFSLNVGNWREIEINLPQNLMNEHCWTQAYVNGKVHWAAYRLNVEEHRTENLIMAFDLSNEVFEELLFPDALVVECPVNLHASVCKDSIAVLHYDSRGCSVWLMQAYGDVKSWSRMYTVDIGGGVQRILSFRKDGSILLTGTYGDFYSYDPNPRIQKIKYIEILGTRDSFFVDRYTESLALLIEGEQVLEGLPNAAESDSSEDDNEGEDDRVEDNEL